MYIIQFDAGICRLERCDAEISLNYFIWYIALIGSLLMFSLEIVFALYNRLAAWINVSHFGTVSIWSAAFGSYLKQFDPPS